LYELAENLSAPINWWLRWLAARLARLSHLSSLLLVSRSSYAYAESPVPDLPASGDDGLVLVHR
jgi:hypothetical protein